METAEWNGFCTEYCGTSHAKMRFRVFTVKPDQFASWVAGQQRPASFGATANAPPPIITPFPKGINEREDVQPKANPTPAPAPNNAMLTSLAPGYTVPRKNDVATTPHTPIPADLKFTPGLTGNAARGQQVFSSSACIGCHTVTGNPMAMGVSGPNLTHFGSRATIAAGNFPNTPAYLALWIKNARKMKPGVIMPTLGKGEYDPAIKATATTGALDDQQIADIVAYLTSLK
jgi:cytochrome c oxidase subunit 2